MNIKLERFPSISGLQQPFSKLIEKASTALKFSVNSQNSLKAPALDGEIVYSKNNVCVHQLGTNEPVPGYLSLRCSMADATDNPSESTLILHWVPNFTIQSNPKSIDTSNPSSRSSSPRHSGADLTTHGAADLNQNNHSNTQKSKTQSPSSSDLETEQTNKNVDLDNLIDLTDKLNIDADITVHYSKRTSNLLESTSEDELELIDLEQTTESGPSQSKSSTLTRRPDILSVASHCSKFDSAILQDADNLSIGSGSTGGPDSRSCSPTSDIASLCDVISLTETAEKIAESHNLLFPADSNAAGAASSDSDRSPSHLPKPGVFSVDLGMMRSLRLFYSEDSTSCGQLVIASRESQYKIFHFYNGGLDKLAEILEDWNLFQSAKRKRWKRGSLSPHTQQFCVVKPKIIEEIDSHPEENLYQGVNIDTWKTFMNDYGQIFDEHALKKSIFFGGIEPVLRKEVWPFLLQYYPYLSTYEEREQIKNDKYLEYQRIRKKREKLCKNETWYSNFWRSVQNIVEKDVVRTDRGHVYYKGEGNSNVEVLKEILLNYAVAHPHLGYTQGMSDLLSPILAEMKDEVDAYWCFVGLMQKTIFITTPKDAEMDKQLLYLKELIRIMFPKFYQHLMLVGESLGLLFVHRWILLCFKREFSEIDALTIWESCWANVQTSYFHLFIALAIIICYSEDVLQERLPSDEMLLHFSNLAHHMNGKLILKKARGLMHQFRLLEQIPCTLQGLCSMIHTGMWDSGHVPAVECVGHSNIDGCPYLGVSTPPVNLDQHHIMNSFIQHTRK